MSPTDPIIETPDAHLAAAIARAERRRGKLERLAEIGMEMAERIGAHAAASAAECGPRCDPAKAFAGVSRAVRLTLAFEGRIDKDILAMRKGVAPAVAGFASAVPASAPSIPAYGSVSKDSPCPRRNRVRDGVWAAISREIGDRDEAYEALDQVHERLIEGEDYDALLFRPWRDSVAATCADLGIDLDWSLWSDEEGFAEPTGPHKAWHRHWRYDPDHAEQRRQKRAERAGPASTLGP